MLELIGASSVPCMLRKQQQRWDVLSVWPMQKAGAQNALCQMTKTRRLKTRTQKQQLRMASRTHQTLLCRRRGSNHCEVHSFPLSMKFTKHSTGSSRHYTTSQSILEEISHTCY